MPFSSQLHIGIDRSTIRVSTDVEGDIVNGLRTPRSSATSVTFSVARATPLKDSHLAPILEQSFSRGHVYIGNGASEYEDGQAPITSLSGSTTIYHECFVAGFSRAGHPLKFISRAFTRDGSDRRAAYPQACIRQR